MKKPPAITMIDKRVGQRLVAGVCAVGRLVSISQLAVAAARAGLQPADYDNSQGEDALIAIAMALPPSCSMIQEPSAWRGAVWHALSIVAQGNLTTRQERAKWRRLELRARQEQARLEKRERESRKLLARLGLRRQPRQRKRCSSGT